MSNIILKYSFRGGFFHANTERVALFSVLSARLGNMVHMFSVDGRIEKERGKVPLNSCVDLIQEIINA